MLKLESVSTGAMATDSEKQHSLASFVPRPPCQASKVSELGGEAWERGYSLAPRLGVFCVK